MSLRPEITGFNLAKMQKFFGCKDDSVIAASKAHLKDFWQSLEGEEEEEACGYLDKIGKGILLPRFAPAAQPGERLKVENATFIFTIISLAYFDQEHTATDSNYYGSCFLDFGIDWGKSLDEGTESQSLASFEFFLGRPLFGEDMDSDWTTYGYLTAKEVEKALNDFDRSPQMKDDEFGEDLHKWLSKIHANRQDLWFFCS